MVIFSPRSKNVLYLPSLLWLENKFLLNLDGLYNISIPCKVAAKLIILNLVEINRLTFEKQFEFRHIWI
jgi:hypothetical protein